jgi:hypothetical protein
MMNGEQQRLTKRWPSAYQLKMMKIQELQQAGDWELFNKNYKPLVAEAPSRVLDRVSDSYYDGSVVLQFNRLSEELESLPKSIWEAEKQRLGGNRYLSLDDAGYFFLEFAPAWKHLFLSARDFHEAGSLADASSLSAFLEDKEPTKPTSSVNEEGDRIWAFEFPYGDEEHGYATYSIEINESKGFLVQAINCKANLTFNDGAVHSIETYTRISRYLKVAEGVYVPQEIERSTRNGEGPDFPIRPVTYYRVSDIKINQNDITPGIGFSIPAFVRVEEASLPPIQLQIGGGQMYPQSIWGPDNKPLITCNTYEDFQTLMAAESLADLEEAETIPQEEDE